MFFLFPWTLYTTLISSITIIIILHRPQPSNRTQQCVVNTTNTVHHHQRFHHHHHHNLQLQCNYHYQKNIIIIQHNLISIIITVVIIIAATPLLDEHSGVSCPTVVHWTISNCWLVFQAATVDSNQPCFLSSRSPIILVGLEPEMGNMSFPIQQIAP